MSAAPRVDWPNAVALVTGASSGIGYETALAFAQRGARVVGVARREDRLRELVAACDGASFAPRAQVSRRERKFRAASRRRAKSIRGASEDHLVWRAPRTSQATSARARSRRRSS